MRLQNCPNDTRIQEAVAHTQDVNAELAKDSARDTAVIAVYLNYIEQHDIKVKPEGQPVQITSFLLGCSACRDQCLITMNSEIVEIGLPVSCHSSSIEPGTYFIGSNLFESH